ncbi:hypothetical protein FACS189415_5550 [Bacteroidia bacterium]|nr:hypothetical protein FACS189415_5550 [Bacteroidia bacterium]
MREGLMFGYVKPLEPELLVREQTIYKAYYCGLCRQLKTAYGRRAQMTLSYDATFLALLGGALGEQEEACHPRRCMAHVRRKRPMMAHPAMEYAAGINIVLSMGSLRDHWQDDRSLSAWVAKLLLGRAHRRAMATYADTAALVQTQLETLHRLEQRRCDDIDLVGDAFAVLLGGLVQAMAQDARQGEALHWLGYNLGKWLYLIDALDDLRKDGEKGGYNVLWLRYGQPGDTAAGLARRIAPDMRFTLTSALSQVALASNVLEFRRNQGLLDNIIHLGLMDTTHKILYREESVDDGSI